MSSKIEFSVCPCCGKRKYAMLQDKVHLDWARECVACGFTIELMPRAKSRDNSYITNNDMGLDDDEFEALSSGLTIGSFMEDLFENLPE